MNSAEVAIRGATPEDDFAVIEILNRDSPAMQTATVESMRHGDANTPKGGARERQVAERDGRVAGFFTLQSRWWTAHPESFALTLVVDPAERGRGVGARLHERALERAAELSARRLYASVLEDRPEAMRFAERRGYRPTGHAMRMSRLDVGEARLDLFGDTRLRMEAAGLRIATLAELGAGEELLRQLYEVDSESGADAPSAEAYEAPTFEQWRQWIFEPGVAPEWFWVALDGDRPVGLTWLALIQEGLAETSYTGVLRAYRGRGVASALKVAATAWARDNGIRYIYTGNDFTNAPMLAINVKLGYEPLPARVEMVREL